MSSVGHRLLSSLIQGGSKDTLMELNLFPELFRDGNEIALYTFIKDHLSEYGVFPAPSTITEELGDVLVDAPEPPQYYLNELENRYLQSQLKKLQIEVNEFLIDQKPNEALNHLITLGLPLEHFKQRHSLYSMTDASKVILKEMAATKLAQVGVGGIQTGYETLDNMSNGIRGGDFCAIVGRPGSGKTWKALAIARNVWRKGGVPLFLSMEMPGIDIIQRIVSMDAHIQYTNLVKAEITTFGMPKFLSKLSEVDKVENKLWILDGKLATTVDQLITFCRVLKPTAVFVDGAYLLRHPDRRASRHDRITENAEWLKQRIAGDLDLPTVATYQINREGAPKKANKKLKNAQTDDQATLENIYGTDAIGQLSSLVLGLLGDPTIENEKKREVTILKGRKGEMGRYSMDWDFTNMEFGEYKPEQDQEMKYSD